MGRSSRATRPGRSGWRRSTTTTRRCRPTSRRSFRRSTPASRTGRSARTSRCREARRPGKAPPPDPLPIGMERGSSFDPSPPLHRNGEGVGGWGFPQSPMSRPSLGQTLLVQALAVLTGLAAGALLIWVTGGDALLAYGGLWEGSLGKVVSISETLVWSTPYILAGLAVG